jgi:hypothetical protein
MADDPPATFDDDTLTIHFKGSRHTIGDCGSCNTAPMIGQIHMEPSGIRDIGTLSLAPELDLLDSLFWRIHRHLPTAQLAAP